MAPPDSRLPTADPKAASRPMRYAQATRTATYGFLSALPLLVLYESLIWLTNEGRIAQVRVGAEVWLKQWLALAGLAGMHVLAAVVLGVGLVVLWWDRRRRPPLRLGYFAGIVAESAVYAVGLAVLVSGVVGALFAMALVGAPPAEALGLRLALSIGAGLYEELVFRVLLVGGLYVVLKRVVARPVAAYLVAAVVGALLFSAVHYLGPLGDPFTLPSFTFRALFGLALNAVFLARGFGVAAWTHALYDVMVVTHLLG